MKNRMNQLAATAERPHVEVLDRPETTNLPDCTVIQKDAIASVGKIPGEITEVPLTKRITIAALFAVIGVKNLDRCEIQRNGQEASLDDVVESGDTILAIAKIRGN